MRLFITLAIFAIAACDRGPPEPSAAQHEQMNDAEEILNEMAANEAVAD